MKRFTSFTAAVLGSAALLTVTSSALAGKKPPPKPDYLVIKMEEVIVTSVQQDGSTQRFDLSGRLHLESQVFMSTEGTATEFDLHANLMDAFASSLDGTLRLRATGSMETAFEPVTPCVPNESCHPGVWSFTFALVPAGPSPIPVPYPNSSLTLQIFTQYDADGKLVNAGILTD
jgi:hypothetical protein